MYQALYRVERPETFDGVLGQEHIVRVLKNQIMSGTTSHAYLFTGTRGTGKTTLARLLAKGVNCTGEGEKPCGTCPNCMSIKAGTFIDVIEIDAASNNGVDNVRELRESVNYPPSVGNKKVYIIDEVHMLSTPAFNALLKTLEEPPENVIFILATTDPQVLPQTILSRCMRFDFKRVPDSLIANDMARICEKRGINITEGALRLLASNADGSVRDGLSLLDQCLAGAGETIDRDDVLDCLGTISDDFFIRLTESVIHRDTAGALFALDEILRDGKDIRQLLADWLSHYRSLLISKFVRTPEDILNISSENALKIAEQARRTALGDINNGIRTIAKTISDAKYSTQPRTLMELAIVTLSAGLGEEPTGTMPIRAGRPVRNERPQQALQSQPLQGQQAPQQQAQSVLSQGQSSQQQWAQPQQAQVSQQQPQAQQIKQAPPQGQPSQQQWAQPQQAQVSQQQPQAPQGQPSQQQWAQPQQQAQVSQQQQQAQQQQQPQAQQVQQAPPQGQPNQQQWAQPQQQAQVPQQQATTQALKKEKLPSQSKSVWDAPEESFGGSFNLTWEDFDEPAGESGAGTVEQSAGGNPEPNEIKMAGASMVVEQPDPENIDGEYLDKLWEDMWNVMGDDIGSLYMARYNTGLAGLTDTEFKVVAGNTVIKTLVEESRGRISDIMSDLMGRPLKMNIRLMDEPEHEERENISNEDLAAQIAAKFNINPRIEE